MDAGTFCPFGISHINTISNRPSYHQASEHWKTQPQRPCRLTALSGPSKPFREAQHIQKVWDQGVVVNQASQLCNILC